jgi:hypothetical protein
MLLIISADVLLLCGAFSLCSIGVVHFFCVMCEMENWVSGVVLGSLWVRLSESFGAVVGGCGA